MTFDAADPGPVCDPLRASAARPRRRAAVLAVAALIVTVAVVATRHGDHASETLAVAATEHPAGTLAPTPGTTQDSAPPVDTIDEQTTTVTGPGPTSTSTSQGTASTSSIIPVSSTAAVPTSPALPEPTVDESTTSTTRAPRPEDVTIEVHTTATAARPSGDLPFDVAIHNGSSAPLWFFRGGSVCRGPDPVFEVSTVRTFDASHGVVLWDGNADSLASLLTPPTASTFAEWDAPEVKLRTGSLMCGPMDANHNVDPGETYEETFPTKLRMSPGPPPASVYARSVLVRESVSGRSDWLHTNVSSPIIELPYVDDPLRLSSFGAAVKIASERFATVPWTDSTPKEWVQATFFDGQWEFRFTREMRSWSIDPLPIYDLTVDAATLAVAFDRAPWS